VSKRKTPGIGMAERSKGTRKLSVAFPNAHMDAVTAEARRAGVSAAEVVRSAVASWVRALTGGGRP
jgi:hypothetical protein